MLLISHPVGESDGLTPIGANITKQGICSYFVRCFGGKKYLQNARCTYNSNLCPGNGINLIEGIQFHLVTFGVYSNAPIVKVAFGSRLGVATIL